MSCSRCLRLVLSSARVSRATGNLYSRNIRFFSGIAHQRNGLDHISAQNWIPSTAAAPSLSKQFHTSLRRHENAMVDMTLDELREEIADGHILLIDVRNEDETESTGVIADAKILPLDRFSEMMRTKKEDFKENYGFEKPLPDDQIAVYCRSGVRAMTAIDALHGMGYQNVRRYSGGWLEWADNNPGLKREPDSKQG